MPLSLYNLELLRLRSKHRKQWQSTPYGGQGKRHQKGRAKGVGLRWDKHFHGVITQQTK